MSLVPNTVLPADDFDEVLATDIAEAGVDVKSSFRGCGTSSSSSLMFASLRDEDEDDEEDEDEEVEREPERRRLISVISAAKRGGVFSIESTTWLARPTPRALHFPEE